MWAVRMLLIIVFLILAIGFFVYNAAERVNIFIVNLHYLDVPLITVVLLAFAAGMIASFLIAVTYFFKISAEARTQRRQARRLQTEITALRNRQIEKVDISEPNEETE
ncbi:MAG: DUF1049 domain-containing protein [candidate division Zixibacteria bacterium]|nr:DUF1049 domain-containing protein [candidate division Zixibacteria bacterium]